MSRQWLVIAATFLAVGCGGGSGASSHYDHFVDAVYDHAAPDAADCGTIHPDDDRSAWNCCFATALSEGRPAVGIARSGGSTKAHGFTVRADGSGAELILYAWDTASGRDYESFIASCPQWEAEVDACAQSSHTALACPDLGDFEPL